MTRLCCPVKEKDFSLEVDLFEILERNKKILYNSKGNPCFLDVDWKKKIPSTDLPVIISYHHHKKTPDLESILYKLTSKHPKATYYKIATMATSSLDSLKMLLFLKNHPNVIGICMGPYGTMTRICAPIFKQPLTYAPFSKDYQTALGQLTIAQLSEIYHFQLLNPSTFLFGLIGSPVSKSIGHLYHNEAFRRAKKNSVYLKIDLKKHELKEFFAAVTQLPFRGFSVTAPLKEEVMAYLDHISPDAQAIGAVNTLCLSDGHVYGDNTDGEAIIESLPPVQHKKIVVLGAGGAARALIYSALKKNAEVIILNRNVDKAKQLAQYFGCEWRRYCSTYDILINATSSECPEYDHFIPGTTVMDLSIYPTTFLKRAQTARCKTISGLSMYFLQAQAQQNIWSFFSPKKS